MDVGRVIEKKEELPQRPQGSHRVHREEKQESASIPVGQVKASAWVRHDITAEDGPG